jgi:hypothetical protein
MAREKRTSSTGEKRAPAEGSGKVVCIICGENKPGIRIKEDTVIRSIKWIKRNITKNEKNNTLVVCRGCYPKYSKERSKYTSRQVLYIALGILFAIFSLLLNPAPLTLLIAAMVLLFFYGLSLLNYSPALDVQKKGKVSGTGAKDS